jgi:hypothetical protein
MHSTTSISSSMLIVHVREPFFRDPSGDIS